MKKKFLSLLLLTTVFALPFAVNAEEAVPSDFNDQRNVVVGDVDTTVYSVDIEWGSLQYDWKYNSATNKFEFKAPLACVAIDGNATMISNLQNDRERGAKIYSDDQCSSVVSGNLSEGTTYYEKSRVDGRIRVVDNSVNGKIKAQATFTPSNSYSGWVVGKFYSGYNNFDVATGTYDYEEELTGNYLRRSTGAMSNSLYGWLKLDVNNQYTGEKTVETGTTIGTVTLAISQDTD